MSKTANPRTKTERPTCKPSARKQRLFGAYKLKVGADYLLIVKEPFVSTQQTVLPLWIKDDAFESAVSMMNISPSDCEFVCDAAKFVSNDLINAAFIACGKANRAILASGDEAYPTLKYICAGGKRKAKSPKMSSIDIQIIEQWPEWQRWNLSMKERADLVVDKTGKKLSEGRLATRCFNLGLKANLHERRRSKRTKVRNSKRKVRRNKSV